MSKSRLIAALYIVATVTGQSAIGALPPAAPTATPTAMSSSPVAPITKPGERVPSEDPIIPNFHSLGLINGTLTIYRCGSPTRALFKKPTDAATQQAGAKASLDHLKSLGITTIISLEEPTGSDSTEAVKSNQINPQVALEKKAAGEAGINFVSDPMSNKGPDSLETMTDDQVQAWLDGVVADIFKYAKTGGVVFHCSAGHDRTGIVAAYIRIKYQHWPVDQAIDEMRRYGHNWPKYSNNGGASSWHEAHLRAIAAKLNAAAATQPAATAP